MIYEHIGLLHELRGSYENAEEMLAKCLYNRLEVLQPSHNLIARSYFNLGSLLEKKGSYEESEEMFLKCLEHKVDNRYFENGFYFIAYKSLIRLYNSMNEVT